MATTVLDETTAAAIRDALGAASRGRIADACRIARDALKSGGEPAALNAMLGTLLCRSGDLDSGLAHLRAAHDARPDDPVIAWNLGSNLAQAGEFESGLEVASAERAANDPTLRLERLRGFLFQQLERYEDAIAAYQRVVESSPGDWESWNNLGNSRRAAGDPDGAIDALQKAVSLVPDSAPVRLNLANAYAAAGKAAEAEREFRAMGTDFPEDWRCWRELHALLRIQNREEEALEAIEAAARRNPDDMELLLGTASQRLLLLDNAGAEDAYREAVRREPSNSVGNLGLAVVFELTNRTDDLAELVGQAAARNVSDEVQNFIQAFDHRRAKRYEEGIASLAKVSDSLETARRAQLLGQLNEGAGNYEEAWAAFERMNEIHRADPSQPEERAAAYTALIRSRFETVNADWAAKWEERRGFDERPDPVFLIGFPRSGTTLLDTFLMGHPDVKVLEEEPTLRRTDEIMSDFATLPTASLAAIRAARDAYFDTVDRLTEVAPGQLLLDKNPLLLNALPLIRRLFPRARIILALRHPCDVVTSCFATNFKLNDAMSNFLRLDSTAQLYDLSFGFFERSQELLPLPAHTVRYESLVEDTTSELKALVDFLGLDWADDLLDHQATARQRGRIKTASYSQVAEPIYSRSAGRWQHYRRHLEPVFPILEPWVTKFGYSL